MSTVLPFPTEDAVFEPDVIKAMAFAFDEACRALNIPDAAPRERAVIAERIVELARRGEHNPRKLYQRVLKEAGLGEIYAQ